MKPGTTIYTSKDKPASSSTFWKVRYDEEKRALGWRNGVEGKNWSYWIYHSLRILVKRLPLSRQNERRESFKLLFEDPIPLDLLHKESRNITFSRSNWIVNTKKRGNLSTQVSRLLPGFRLFSNQGRFYSLCVRVRKYLSVLGLRLGVLYLLLKIHTRPPYHTSGRFSGTPCTVREYQREGPWVLSMSVFQDILVILIRIKRLFLVSTYSSLKPGIPWPLLRPVELLPLSPLFYGRGPVSRPDTSVNTLPSSSLDSPGVETLGAKLRSNSVFKLILSSLMRRYYGRWSFACVKLNVDSRLKRPSLVFTLYSSVFLEDPPFRSSPLDFMSCVYSVMRPYV